MSERIPQSVAKRCALKAYLSSDHVSLATGKTIAIVISKNGGSFANPSGGATNATEIANGWYYVDLTTTDAGTTGPLILRGTSSGVDDVERDFEVANAHNAGFDGVPAVIAGASTGLPLSVDSSGRVDVLKINGTSQTARDLGASVLIATQQIAIKKNASLAGYTFPMVDASGVPQPLLTVSAQRSIDGGSLASCTNSVTEISGGLYKITLSAADLNGNLIVLVFAATGAKTLIDRFATQT